MRGCASIARGRISTCSGRATQTGWAEAQQLEGALDRTATPAQRYDVVRALRGHLAELVDQDPVRVATMLRRAGIRIEVDDGQVVAITLR
jgi:hypothetical protein